MPNAEDSQLQKKARHRLIGAVVFVSIAALALILAMDAEPTDTHAPTLIIPSEDGTEVFPMDGGLALPQTLPQTQPQTSPAPELAPPAITPPAPPPDAPAAQPSPPPPAAVVRAEPSRPTTATTPATVTPRPQSTPTPTPTPAPTAKTAPVANPALQDADRAAAILAGRSPGVAGNDATQLAATSYIVQVFASSNRDAIRDTVEKLRSLKLPVYTETASGDMTRVRVGPYVTQSEAEAAERKINQDGKIAGTKIYPQSPPSL